MRKLNDYKQYSTRGMEYDKSDVNKVTIFTSESLKHWVAKTILFYKLRQLGHNVVSEVPIPGLGVADLIDLTLNIQYEIELDVHKHIRESKAKKYQRDGVEIIVVHCHKMPTDIKELSSFLDPYIIVD